jgi:hypothetical protein
MVFELGFFVLDPVSLAKDAIFSVRGIEVHIHLDVAIAAP